MSKLADIFSRRKTRVLFASFAGLLILYAAFGFLAVPGLVRSQIEDFSARHYQREPSVGDVSFNPFSLELEVDDFSFSDSRGAALLSFDRLRVNVDVASLWRRGLSFSEIELHRPGGHVRVRDDGSFNLSELTAPFAASGEETQDSEPARLFIDKLVLRDGTFEFEDQARATPFRARLAPVNFELLDFSTTGAGGNHYALQAMSTQGERFRWSGSFGLAPLSSRGEFELAEVRARTLWSYLQESLGFEIASGVVGVQGNYHVAATEPDFTATATLSRIGVTDLGVRPRDGAEDWIHIDALTIGDARLDVTRRLLEAASLQVEGGRVLANRAPDGTLNLVTLLGTPSAENPPAVQNPPAAENTAAARNAPSAEGAPASTVTADTADPADTSAGANWTVNVPDIGVRDLRVDAHDAFVKPAASFVIAPANLTLRGFSTLPDTTMDIDANFALESGGRLAVQGKARPADSRFEGKVSLGELNLAALQPYVGTYTQMTLLSGLLSAELDTAIDAAGQSIKGHIESSKLHTVDNALREDFIKWDRLALVGFAYQSSGSRAPSLRIATISARSPYVRLIIAPDQSTNVGKVLTLPASAPGPVQTVSGVSDEPTGAQNPMAIEIGRVRVQNGSANFADFWITPNYAVSLQQLAGDVSGLSSRKDSRARLALTGKIDRYAPVEIAGELNLLSASLFTDIRVKFDGVELTSVTPYSGRFAGYRIEKGKLSVDVRYRVEDRKLDAEQRFVVDQLTLGERVDSPDAVKLPLRLAVALLKDRNGVIDLGLPVTGSLDDPKFRLGPIIWKAFVNLLAGVATSPFKLLGSVFGGGEEVNLIDFEPGSATLDPAASEKLAALVRALRERPQLALEVPAIYAPDADVATLATKALEAKLQAQAKGPIEDAAHRFTLLLAAYRADKGGSALPPAAQALQEIRARDRESAAIEAANAELEAALRAGVESLQPELEALATLRARNIQDALLASAEVEPARVFLLSTGAKPAVDGKVRVALSLK